MTAPSPLLWDTSTPLSEDERRALREVYLYVLSLPLRKDRREEKAADSTARRW